MIRILITCKTGITASKLVKKVKEIAEGKETEFEIKSVAYNQLKKDRGNYDVLLIGPQLLVSQTKKIVGNKLPVEAIDMYDYSSMNAASVLDQAIHAFRGEGYINKT